MQNEIIKLIEDGQGEFQLSLSEWVLVPFEQKLEVYMYCRENGLIAFLDYENKNKCFRKKGVADMPGDEE